MGAHGASDRLRVLVVGLGSMGNRRLRNLAHLGEPDVAAFEPDPERRQQAEQRGVPVFETFERALEWGPDALVISTPPDRHHEYAMAAAAHGLHFFTEASVVPGRTQELIEAVGDQAIVAAPSCTLRFHPGIQLLARRLEAGAVGRPLAVVHHVGQHLADWHPWEDYRHFYAGRRDTGAARELVVYELNWMTQLFGPIRQVQGIARKVSALELEIDDLYAAIIGFGSGVEGALVVEVISRPAVRPSRVGGEAGTPVWDFGAPRSCAWIGKDGEC